MLKDLVLKELGVELYKNHIKVNKSTYETNVKGIYAIGDVIGPPWLSARCICRRNSLR